MTPQDRSPDARIHERFAAFSASSRRGRTSTALLAAAAIAAVSLSLGGCSTPPSEAPTVFSLERATYAEAFDEAVRLVADEGMPAVLRDRDGGVIESRPSVSGSLLEPWDWPGGDVGAATESTLNYHRRRVRFEFVPTGFRPRDLREDAPLEGMRTPGTVDPADGGAVDLAARHDAGAANGLDGTIELRVWVYIERAYTPYLQRSTWTFQNRSFARDPQKERGTQPDGSTRDASVWTPVSRDADMEAQLLAKLRERLERPAPAAAPTTDTATPAAADAAVSSS